MIGLRAGRRQRIGFRGGVHPLGRKHLAADSPIDVIPSPSPLGVSITTPLSALNAMGAVSVPDVPMMNPA